MFATLVGAYPRTPHAGQPFRLRAAYGRLERGEIDRVRFREVQDELVCEVIEEQIDAGLGLLTDGQVRWDAPLTPVACGLEGFALTALRRYFDTDTYYRQPLAQGRPRWTHPIFVADWRFADEAARDATSERNLEPLPVKACLVGPYTLARLSDPGDLSRETLTMALAEALGHEVRALVDAGAPVIQIDENALTMIGRADDSERKLASRAFSRLTEGVRASRSHLCLAVTMGSAEHAGPDVLYGSPFASYLFDLIAGPDSWRVIAYAPRERGVICGVADARGPTPDHEPVMVWAARYAASMNGRGPDRVGLAPSAGLEHLPRDKARAKITGLAEAARKSGLSRQELRGELDPRSMMPGRQAAGTP